MNSISVFKWIFTGSFLLLSVFTNGQVYKPFAKDSTEWLVSWSHSAPFSAGWFIYKAYGDTSLLGKTYYKIYKSPNVAFDDRTNDVLLCLIREDSLKKVYIRYVPPSFVDTNEYVLYDFNLTIGDTIMISRKSSEDDSTFSSSSLYLVSDTSSYIDEKGMKRAILKLLTDYGEATWVEGIGNFEQPFQCELFPNWEGMWSFQLDCFYEKGSFLFGFCSTIEIVEMKKNPESDVLSVSYLDELIEIAFVSNAPRTIQILDITGREIQKEKVCEEKHVIDNQKYAGIYIIRTYNHDNAKVTVFKIVMI